MTGWADLLKPPSRHKKEFVSVDARLDDIKKDSRSYEMLSRGSGKTIDDVVTPPSAVTPVSPAARSPYGSPERRTSDYFSRAVRYPMPERVFQAPPRPPQATAWYSSESFDGPGQRDGRSYEDMNPLGMNRI